MRQSLRSIQLFVAAYEELSFTQAAHREAATQSGVSQHVSELESSLGVKLFVRKAGSVTPTPAGTAYYSACIELLNAGERALRAVKPFQQGSQGHITVGMTPVTTRAMFAPAYVRFTRDNPNMAVHLIDSSYDDLVDRVRAGEMNFAIVPSAVGFKGVRTQHFARTPELLVSARASGHAGSPFEHGKPITPRDLARLSLVVPGIQNARRTMIETYLAAHGVVPYRVTEFTSMLGTLDLVARSEWSTILPLVMMGRDFADGPYAINPITSPDLVLDLHVIEPARRSMDDASLAFLACLRDELRLIHRAARIPSPQAPRRSRKA